MKRLLVVLSALPLMVNAQDLNDTTRVNELDPVLISADKYGERKKEIPYTMELIDIKQIEFQNAQNTGDMLMNSGSVFVQKSQQGGSSPSLRGFEASRVLLVVDGVRMNNAIYRAGHLQDVITLDQSMFDRTEILFGPSSVMYGSDALGGVMCFYTRKAVFGDDSGMYVNSNSWFRWSSANNEFSGHADINLGWKKLASITSFTHSTFGDLRAGSNRHPFYDQYWRRDFYIDTINGTDTLLKNPDPNTQLYSGYSQYDLFQKFSWKVRENILQTVNLQYSNSSNIPRYDRLTDTSANGDLRFAEWYYGPQLRLMSILNTRVLAENKIFNSLSISLAAQKIRQQRITRRYKNNDRNIQEENLLVFSFNTDFVKFLSEKHDIHYGIEVTYNDVQSDAHTRNRITDEKTPYPTRYPNGGSTMSSYAGYFAYKGKVAKNKIILTAGLRYSAGSISADFSDTAFYPFPYAAIGQRNSALTWTAGVVWNPSEKWKFALMNSSGFRSPNVDDLAKVFDSSPGMLIVPNPDLAPEKVINTEISADARLGKHLHAFIAGWYTVLTDAIVVKDFIFDGKDSLLYDGQMSQVQAAQNADDGMITGLTGTLHFLFNDLFTLKSSATYTYGRYHDSDNDTVIPLDHVPPAFGQTALNIKSKKAETEIYVRYNGPKLLRDYSPSGEDNLQYATAEGMPSWVTLNFKTAFRINRMITVNTGVENILDTHYRHFASGISAPGRNFFVTLRGKF
ncbi:MAG: TonB-dependent receptor [Bacteroidia bacterium]|nr:TonB-dependent receptor [Bacteroidia bacterium]